MKRRQDPGVGADRARDRAWGVRRPGDGLGDRPPGDGLGDRPPGDRWDNAELTDGGRDDASAIAVGLDALLEQRGMTLTDLSERVGVTIVNLSILKNGRARAIRFSTLARLCQALECQPGDLLAYQPDE